MRSAQAIQSQPSTHQNYPSQDHAGACAGERQPGGLVHVGDSRLSHEPRMTDAEREQAAYRAGVAMQSWYSRYQQSGDQSALDMAYRHLGQMRDILAGRTPQYVARLEQERGLA